jgi:hypothetical protein
MEKFLCDKHKNQTNGKLRELRNSCPIFFKHDEDEEIKNEEKEAL